MLFIYAVLLSVFFFLLLLFFLYLVLQFTTFRLSGVQHNNMVVELVRDTAFGHALRLITGGKVMTFEEERDPSIWKRYIDKEKSGRMAHHGHIGEEEKETKEGDDTESTERGTGEREVNDSNGNANSTGRDQSTTQAGGVLSGDTRRSSETRTGSTDNGQQRNEISGVPVDPEKGRDVSVVTWYGDDDPEVCLSLFMLACAC